MSIAIVKLITKSIVTQLIDNGVKTIIYHQLSSEVNAKELKERFELVEAFDADQESWWFSYERVSKELDQIEKRFPELFVFEGIGLKDALRKELYWAMSVENALNYQVYKRQKSGDRVEFYDKRSDFKQFAALIKNLFFDNTHLYSIRISPTENFKGKIAFRINSPSVPSIFGNLFKELGRDNVISFQSNSFTPSREQKQSLSSLFSENIATESAKNDGFISNSLKLRLVFSSFDREFVIRLVQCHKKLINHILQYKKLFEAGVKKIVFNAGENSGEANVVWELAKRYGAFTFNYMNGAKAKTPQNMNSHFDYWFMPNQDTQELIMSYCDLPAEKLPVTGHLTEELAQEHQYQGSIDEQIADITDKKIISLFTSSFYRNEILAVTDFLRSYIAKRGDVAVLVKRHPTEKLDSSDINLDGFIEIKNVAEEKSRHVLFDLLLKSEVAISFSSTVSLQASWFRCTSINYEDLMQSRLPYVDNIRVLHVKNVGELELILGRLDQSVKTGFKEKYFDSPSSQIASLIESF